MKFIENIYFDESQNKYIIDHSKGISTIDKANIKHIEYQYAYTNKYWFSFPLVILLIILNFSYRNFSYPNFFEHKLAYTILILILLSALLLCIEFIVFFRSKFTIYHEKNETFYFNQLTSSFNFYGAFQSRNIKCENIRKNKKDNPNGFFQIFCLVVPTILFLGSYQSFLPKLTLHFVSDFKVINFLWLTSIIFVLLRFLNLTLTFIYTPILLLIGLLNVWEKKYTEIVYHEIFTFFKDYIEDKITLYSSMIIGFIYYSICFTLFEYPKIPFLILTVCLIFLFTHRFFYLKKINYSNIDNVFLYYLNDTEIEDQLILSRNYNALASITPGYIFWLKREHLHVFYNHKWLNQKFEIFQSTYDLKKINLFFPEFINIQYFKKDYLFYLENVILKEKEELVIIPYFILDEEILFAIIKRDKTYLINDILDRFVYNNENTYLYDNLIELQKEKGYIGFRDFTEIKNNKKATLEAVKLDGNALLFASEEFKNDKEIVLTAIKSNRNALQFASKKLQNDKEVVLCSFEGDGSEDYNSSISIFQYVSNELQVDKDVLLAFFQFIGWRYFYEYSSKYLQPDDKELIIEVVKSHPDGLNFASKRLKSDKELVLEAVKSHGSALEYASKELKNDKEVVLQAVKSHGSALEYASKELQNDKEVVLQAVKSHGSALEYASKELKNDKEIVLEAVKSSYYALDNASKELQNDKEVVLQAVKSNGGALKFTSKELLNDKEIVLHAVKSNGYVLQYASKKLQNNKEIVFQAVKSCRYALQYASKELQNDIDLLLIKDISSAKYSNELNDREIIVFESLNSNGNELGLTSKELQNNKDILLLALKSNRNALQYASKELLNDKEFILEVVKSDGYALQYASIEFKADKEIVLQAVKSNGRALQFTTKELQNDKEVVLQAVKTSEALELASKELQNDKEVVLEAVKYYDYSLEFASKELKNDKEVVLEAVKKYGYSLKFASYELLNDRSFILKVIKLTDKNHLIENASTKVRYMLVDKLK